MGRSSEDGRARAMSQNGESVDSYRADGKEEMRNAEEGAHRYLGHSYSSNNVSNDMH